MKAKFQQAEVGEDDEDDMLSPCSTYFYMFSYIQIHAFYVFWFFWCSLCNLTTVKCRTWPCPTEPTWNQATQQVGPRARAMAKLSGHLERPASTKGSKGEGFRDFLADLASSERGWKMTKDGRSSMSVMPWWVQSKLTMSLAIVKVGEEILQFTACTQARAHLLRSAKVDDLLAETRRCGSRRYQFPFRGTFSSVKYWCVLSPFGTQVTSLLVKRSSQLLTLTEEHQARIKLLLQHFLTNQPFAIGVLPVAEWPRAMRACVGIPWFMGAVL